MALATAAALAFAGCGQTIGEEDENGMIEEPAENESEVTADPEYLAAPAPGCRPGLRKCGSKCVNVKSDTRNCGACNRRCAAGARCTNSRCVRPAPKRDAAPPKRDAARRG